MEKISDEWECVDFLEREEFEEYIQCLDENDKAHELELYGKHMSIVLLRDYMKTFTNFYSFIREYSPCDFKMIHRKPHVSQRVIVQHVQMWNEVNKNKIKTMRVFFT